MEIDLHKLADARSLELHREVARRIAGDPSIVATARAKVGRWLADGSVHPVYAREWAAILDGPREELREVLTATDQHSVDLRHVTPFSFVVPPRERWRIWRETRERLEAGE